jgi:hypothetical protein
MTATHTHTVPRPLYERVLKFVVIGGFTLLMLYIKALAAILKLGIQLIKKIPTEKRQPE